jgi:IS30 family transposase
MALAKETKKEIRRLHSEGLSFEAMAEALNKAGHKTISQDVYTRSRVYSALRSLGLTKKPAPKKHGTYQQIMDIVTSNLEEPTKIRFIKILVGEEK